MSATRVQTFSVLLIDGLVTRSRRRRVNTLRFPDFAPPPAPPVERATEEETEIGKATGDPWSE